MSEPLLTVSSTNPSTTNLVVDYLASTHPPVSVRQSATTTSVFSTRAITTPQHPSQVLVSCVKKIYANIICSYHFMEISSSHEGSQDEFKFIFQVFNCHVHACRNSMRDLSDLVRENTGQDK